MAISPNQLLQLLIHAPEQDMILACGEPGCAKSAIGQQASRIMGMQYWPFWVGTKEAVEFSGLPALTQKDGRTYGTWHPFERMFPLDGESHNGWIFINLDDLSHANPSVIKSAVRCIYGDGSERRMGSHLLYPKVRLYGTANLHTQRAGAVRLDTYVSNRVCRVEIHPPTGRDWLRASGDGKFELPETDSAYPAMRERINAEVDKGIPETLAAFIAFAYREKPLTSFDPEADSFLSARSITQLGRFERALDAAGINGDILFEVAKGTIGEGEAANYLAFRKLRDELPDIDAILAGKETRLPERAEVCYMLVSSIVRQAEEKHCSIVAKLIGKLADSSVPEAVEISAFLAFECLTGSAKQLRGVRSQPDLMKWLGKYGKYLP